MSIMSILSLLNSVGITKAELDAAVEEAAKEAVIAKTREVQAYWKSIAPVAKHDRVHTYTARKLDLAVRIGTASRFGFQRRRDRRWASYIGGPQWPASLNTALSV
jgi:hypothetical protein